ncbi:MAG: methyltransferase domain-containing protein, partial [Actinomycetota bacterium]|nr:methyltransferase domain-containing protein [Actinomycetota bacterium]
MSGTDGPEQRSQRTFDLQSVFDAEDSQEVAELYDASAEDYEQRILSWGYSTHAVAAWFFGRYVEPEDGAAVLDAGTGTGLMGDILAPLGYRDLVGNDISSNMLELARKKGAYKDLHQ